MQLLVLFLACAGRSDGPPPSVGPWSEDGTVTEYKPVVSDELDRISYGRAVIAQAFEQEDAPTVENTGPKTIPPGPQRGVVSLRVDAQGRLLWVELSRSTGFEELDQAVLERIREEAQFAAPEAALLDEEAGLTVQAAQFVVDVLGEVQSDWRMLSEERSKAGSAYMAAMNERMSPVFEAALMNRINSMNPPTGVYTCRLRLKLNARGQVAEIEVTQPSGLAGYDNIVLSSVRSAAPYGPPPRSHLGPDGLMWIEPYDISIRVRNEGGDLRFSLPEDSETGWADQVAYSVFVAQ